MGRTFTGERPPARRTTDAAMAGIAVGMTACMAAIIVRAALRQDWTAVWVFGIGGVILAVPTVVLVWLVLAWHLERRSTRARTAEELTDTILAHRGRPTAIPPPARAVPLEPGQDPT